jgi:hypothetical protein
MSMLLSTVMVFAVDETNTPVNAESEGVAVNESLREAMDLGVKYLRGLAAADESGWFCPPIRNQQKIGEKEVQVRYSKKVIKQPVYEYKKVEVYRNVREGDSVDAVAVRKKVTEERPVRQIGTRDVEQLVRDPSGDIVRTEKQGVYGPGGIDQWLAGQWGQNAMAAYAMMRCGVDPADETVYRVLEKLNGIYEDFGLPDWTWDVAWSLAAFSLSNDAKFQRMAAKLAGRLMDGQIDSGPAAGMWGPTCVNAKLLAALFAMKEKASEEYSKAQGSLKQKGRADEAAVTAALQKLNDISAKIKTVTLAGGLGGEATSILKLDHDISPAIRIMGLPDYIYNQRSADLESTALAVYALNVAGQRKMIPDQSERPEAGRGRPLTPPIKVSDVLAQALRLITGVQNQDGSFNECNRVFPVADFRMATTLPGVPMRNPRFPALGDPATFTATMQGASVLYSIGVLGGAGVHGQLQARRQAAYAAGLAGVKEWQGRDDASKAGGLMPPYEAFFMAAGLLKDMKPETGSAFRQIIQKHALDQQEDDGSWSGPNRAYFSSTSYRARLAVLPVSPLSGRPRSDFDFSQPHVPVDYAKKNVFALLSAKGLSVTPTSYALLAVGALSEKE